MISTAIASRVRFSSAWYWMGAAILTFAASLGFAVITGQVWEDYYITFRSSRNFVEGHGLVYHQGDPVHTFTSPLGVLLPAFCYWVGGSETSALWMFRMCSAAFLAGAAALTFRYGRDHGWTAAPLAVVLILGFLESKVIAFSANGMETAILIFFCVLTWKELTRKQGTRWPHLAIGYAGLMWTRPDAFILAGALSLAWWLFGSRDLKSPPERVWWRNFLGGLIVGVVIYLPWLVWAWIYYGSPIPQTVVAKSIYAPEGFTLARLLASPLRCLVDNTALDGLFMPIYYASGGWPRDLMAAGRFLARLSAFLWILPFLPRNTRAASFATLIGGAYFHQIMPYPWYYGPWTVIAAYALAGSIQPLLQAASGAFASATRIAVVASVTLGLLVTLATSYTCKIQQQVIENGGRKPIGLWLKEQAERGDSVFLEPIGYIGYFSNLKILDFPGLVSREVSSLIERHGPSYAVIITSLRPDWIVIRPSEISDQKLNADGLVDYTLVRTWNNRDALDAHRLLPGRNWPEFDAEYLIFRRQARAE